MQVLKYNLTELYKMAQKHIESDNVGMKILGEVIAKAYMYAGGKRDFCSEKRLGDSMKGDGLLLIPLDMLFKVAYCQKEIVKYWNDRETLRRTFQRIGTGRKFVRCDDTVPREYIRLELTGHTQDRGEVAILYNDKGGIKCIARGVISPTLTGIEKGVAQIMAILCFEHYRRVAYTHKSPDITVNWFYQHIIGLVHT